jgi:predicted pyridoxine 5'-phosphate oxidase superfamily flavin-nucleotide-binding protein
MSAEPFHTGELSAQQRFNADWNEEKSKRLSRIIGDALDEKMAHFVESLPFFFLATADADGRCDCSFKGTETTTDGRLLPKPRQHRDVLLGRRRKTTVRRRGVEKNSSFLDKRWS